jgi:hypothetical protein
VKNFLFILVIIWCILGASAANDRGFFDSNRNRDCTFVGSALLTVVAGGLNYVGVHPTANC